MFYVQTTCLVAIFSLLVLSSAMIYQLDMPNGLKTYFDGAKLKHNVSDIPGEQIFWECMQKVMWQMSEQMGHNVTRETRDYLNRLLKIALDPKNRRISRHRKEYRVISDEERNRFHNAVRALKEDKTLKPNVYSAMAELHAGEVIPMAHFGPGFPGWHRVYLLIFETALRLKDPSVSVPYWASNLDHEMDDPTKSIIWSDKFLGNGDGFVTSGPFADFRVHTTDSILTRNVGASGSLMTNQGIHDILSQNHTADITNPKAPHSHNLELQHNTVHVWVGGNMDDLSISGEDPVFYMHHSFIDYLWEEFRTRQKGLGINPELDYPKENWGAEQHDPEALLGFGDLRNVDALSNVFADLVKYDPEPVCSRTHPTCGSKYLRCELSSVPPVCVSLSYEEIEHGEDSPVAETCLESHLVRAVQNSFAINQFCDIRRWSYIPVKIVLQRPPEFTSYKAYPVLNNRPVNTSDVFSTISINKTISKKLATYPSCKLTTSIARNIYIESYGLNYYGKYKDFTVLDQRHALSSATAYLGVKSPESNHTDVIVYAYDYCGRSCRPFCFDVTSDPPDYRPCSGTLRITTEEPKMYGDNYAEAINNVWHADDPGGLPKTSLDFAYLTFYCDYSGVWPWMPAVQNNASKTITKAKPIVNQVKSKYKGDKRKRVENQKPLVTNIYKSKLNKTLPKVVVRNSKVKQKEDKKVRGLRISSHSRNNGRKTRKKSPAFISKTNKKTYGKRGNMIKKPATSLSKSKRPVLQRSPGRAVSRSRSTSSGLRSSETHRAPSVQRHLDSNNGRSQLKSDFDLNENYFQKYFGNPLVRRPLFRHAFPQHDMVPFVPDVFGFPETLSECRLHTGCILSVPCSPCQHKDHHPCQVPSRMVAVCVNGVFILEHFFFDFVG